MPLGEGFYGTNADETPNTEYCKFCFFDGHFTEPDLTLPEMIARSREQMITELDFAPDRADELTANTIPQLARWQTNEPAI